MKLDKESVYDENMLFLNTYNRLKLLALSCFKWNNLPNNIESRHIEEFLYSYGQCTFLEDKNLGFICLPSSNLNGINIYGDCNEVRVRGVNGSYSKNVNINGSIEEVGGIRILNNDLGYSTDYYTLEFTDKMTEVLLSINANVVQQKFPCIFETNKKNEFTMKNLFKKILRGIPVIYTNEKLQVNESKFYGTNVPFVVDRLESYRKDLEAQILTFYGLDNTKDKSERMLVDEINVNNQFISRNIEIMYKNRLKACEHINEKYGLNIEVVRVDVEEKIELSKLNNIIDNNNKEGEE